MTSVLFSAVGVFALVIFVSAMRNPDRMNREREQLGLPPMDGRVMSIRVPR